jgi:hypothetical protein
VYLDTYKHTEMEGGCARTAHPLTRCAIDAVITYEGSVRALTDMRVGDMVTVTTDT